MTGLVFQEVGGTHTCLLSDKCAPTEFLFQLGTFWTPGNQKFRLLWGYSYRVYRCMIKTWTACEAQIIIVLGLRDPEWMIKDTFIV